MTETVDQWHAVGAEGDVPLGEMAARDVGAHQIAIYNIEGELFCTDNICSHAYALLTDGWLDGEVVECPLHGARFDVRTGKAVCGPATCDVKTYPIRIIDGRIEVSLPV